MSGLFLADHCGAADLFAEACVGMLNARRVTLTGVRWCGRSALNTARRTT
jgi:hypothetical protein